jgi:hypothetical protein
MGGIGPEMMKYRLAFFTFLASTSVCMASGWQDYTLDIGDGYNVFRANSMDVCIGKANGRIILHPWNYAGVGPVVQYINAPQHILTKNFGRKPRNLFEGDSFEEIDPSRSYFFVIAKANDRVHGPLSEEELSQRPEVANLGTLDWQTPKNPNFWRPLLGNLFFLALSIPILAIKFFWITIPAIIGLNVLVRYIRKKRKAQPEVGQVSSEAASSASPDVIVRRLDANAWRLRLRFALAGMSMPVSHHGCPYF